MLECSSAQHSGKADTKSRQRHGEIVPKSPDWHGPNIFEGLQLDPSQPEHCSECHRPECMLHSSSADQLPSQGRYLPVSLAALVIASDPPKCILNRTIGPASEGEAAELHEHYERCMQSQLYLR